MMIKFNRLLIVFACFLYASAFITGCKKSKEKEDNIDDGIYVSGFFRNAGNILQAAYWHNGKETLLADTAIASAMTVYENDIYIAGSVNYDVGYWKNGVFKVQIPNVKSTAIWGIAVSGNDVYLLGIDDSNRYAYWKNGVKTFTPDIWTTGIAVMNNDVYITGEQDEKAVYLKNGVMNYLPGGRSTATNIIIKNNDVYICGSSKSPNAVYSIATVWKNGVQMQLADTASTALAVDVEGDNIYTAGQVNRNPYAAAVWKNKSVTILADHIDGTEAVANSVAVKDNDVYVAGTATDPGSHLAKATLWHNGSTVYLSDQPSTGSGIGWIKRN